MAGVCVGGWEVGGGVGSGEEEGRAFRVVRCTNTVLGSQSQLLLITLLAAGLERDPDGHIHPASGEIHADDHMLMIHADDHMLMVTC